MSQAASSHRVGVVLSSSCGSGQAAVGLALSELLLLLLVLLLLVLLLLLLLLLWWRRPRLSLGWPVGCHGCMSAAAT